ncbi:hypothetical protein D3C87_1981640 [compost metagenome]
MRCTAALDHQHEQERIQDDGNFETGELSSYRIRICDPLLPVRTHTAGARTIRVDDRGLRAYRRDCHGLHPCGPPCGGPGT